MAVYVTTFIPGTSDDDTFFIGAEVSGEWKSISYASTYREQHGYPTLELARRTAEHFESYAGAAVIVQVGPDGWTTHPLRDPDMITVDSAEFGSW